MAVVAIFQSWRLKLKEVEATLKVGRLDEAFQQLTQSGLLEFLPAKHLAKRLSLLFCERAKRRSQLGDFSGGWKDLAAALSLAEIPACDVAKRVLVDAGIERIEHLVECGDLSQAAAQLDALEHRASSDPRVQSLRQLVRSLQSAHHLGRRGKFGDAESHLHQALALRPQSLEIDRRLTACRDSLKQIRSLSERLFRTLEDSNYQDAIRVCDQLLMIAPEMKLAEDARKRAWQHVGADYQSGGHSTFVLNRPQRSSERSSSDTHRRDQEMGPRCLLWIDGVGGYLVCLGPEVVLGQAVDGNLIDIPILGDLSRKHARIRRSGEGYVLDPWHAVKINGKSVNRTAVLCDGDELELGTGVRFRFRRPHALSASARLEPLSRHRTQPYTDGILLMAESCVLGPRWTNHVVCRDWSADVVLSQADGQLYCRSLLPVEIDGRQSEERGKLAFDSRVVGADFSMCLEELDRCSRQPLV